MAVANYLTNENAQATRFAELQSGPTNKNVSNMEDVKANGPLAALAAQNNAGGVLQGDIPGAWWGAIETYAKSIKKGEITESNLKLADLVAEMTPVKG